MHNILLQQQLSSLLQSNLRSKEMMDEFMILEEQKKISLIMIKDQAALEQKIQDRLQNLNNVYKDQAEALDIKYSQQMQEMEKNFDKIQNQEKQKFYQKLEQLEKKINDKSKKSVKPQKEKPIQRSDLVPSFIQPTQDPEIGGLVRSFQVESQQQKIPNNYARLSLQNLAPYREKFDFVQEGPQIIVKQEIPVQHQPDLVRQIQLPMVQSQFSQRDFPVQNSSRQLSNQSMKSLTPRKAMLLHQRRDYQQKVGRFNNLVIQVLNDRNMGRRPELTSYQRQKVLLYLDELIADQLKRNCKTNLEELEHMDNEHLERVFIKLKQQNLKFQQNERMKEHIFQEKSYEQPFQQEQQSQSKQNINIYQLLSLEEIYQHATKSIDDSDSEDFVPADQAERNKEVDQNDNEEDENDNEEDLNKQPRNSIPELIFFTGRGGARRTILMQDSDRNKQDNWNEG